MTNSANRLFEDASSEILGATWERYPSLASGLGLHEYDGLLPSMTREAHSRRLAELDRGVAALERIDAAALNMRNYYDCRILAAALRKERLEIADLRWHETNPMELVGHIEFSGYIQREYAPLDERIAALALALAAVPRFIDEVKATMSGRLAAPTLRASVDAYAGVADFYDGDLAAAAGAVNDADLRGRFDDARAAASAAVRGFVDLLTALQPYADAGFAIGRERFSALLLHGEMVDLPLERLLAAGEDDLRRNLAAFQETAALIDAKRSPSDVMAMVAADHPAADALIDEARDTLEGLRRFIVENDIVSIPSDIRCRVVPTPSFMRWAFAALDFPGPYEDKATEAYYYVTPVEDGWSAAQKEEWLTAFNYASLKAVSAHEAYPGHYTHYLHTRERGSMISRAFGAYSFWEGWAHYAEHMMAERGYGGGDPRVALGQLAEALLRDCRYVCAIRMHAHGMTLDEAARFFMDNAYMEDLPARTEAARGAFDPMYLNYTLGKLMILKLRDDYRAARGSAYTLKGFHDELLSFGAPPLPLAREMMLGGVQGDIL